MQRIFNNMRSDLCGMSNSFRAGFRDAMLLLSGEE